MCPDAPYFIILLCLMPDNCTRQGESAATQCMGYSNYLPMHPVNPLSGSAPYFIIFTLSNARLFYSV